MENKFDLSNKVYLITGATSGIGLEIFKQINNYGGSCIGIGRDLTELNHYNLKNAQFSNLSFQVDLNNEIEILNFILKLPKVDGFIHCAGIVESNLIQFFKRDLYSKIRNINLDSCLTILSELLNKRKIKNGASVVFMSSISGEYGMKGNGLYGITKASLNIMAKTYANELAKKKIRVNCVSPGMVNTKITKNASELLSASVIDEDKKKYPLGYGDPIDVALPVVFLLSEASKWITGQVINIDGGRTAII